MRVPAVYSVEEWERGWAVVRDGLDLRDCRETPRRRLAPVVLYADELVAEQVAFLLNTQRGHEVDQPARRGRGTGTPRTRADLEHDIGDPYS